MFVVVVGYWLLLFVLLFVVSCFSVRFFVLIFSVYMVMVVVMNDSVLSVNMLFWLNIGNMMLIM